MKWSDKAMTQLSFYNNLILTFSIGFLSFCFKPESFSNISFSLKQIDCSITLKALSILFVLLSLFSGLILVLNRLLDFRISRNINQIRKLVYVSNSTLLNDGPGTEYNLFKKLALIFVVIFNTPKISMNDCRNFKDLNIESQKSIKKQFDLLRETSFNLGQATWLRIYFQTSYFFLSILTYVFSLLLN